MRAFLKTFILIMVATLLIECGEEDVSSREYPRLKTLPVTNITADGATFNAEITIRGSFEVLSYGFVWNTDKTPTVDSSEKIEVHENINTLRFSLHVTSALKEDEKYYYKAFLITDDYTVYGKELTFILNN